MVTATCRTDGCNAKNIDEFMCGNPNPVLCGQCGMPCELSDEYADPPEVSFVNTQSNIVESPDTP